jgi:dTDP-4-dehydrorhamnose reductase
MSDSILITGGAGKLGTALHKIMPTALAAVRSDFDITNQLQINSFLD